jgi:hypothetical protein
LDGEGVEGSSGGGIDISSLSASGSRKGTFLICSARGIGRGDGELGVEVIVMERMCMLEGDQECIVQIAVGYLL